LKEDTKEAETTLFLKMNTAFCICSMVLYQVITAQATKYVPLEGCARDEGNTLAGPFKGCDGLCCQDKCDSEPRCNSISLFSVAKVCYLKDKCITPAEPVKINKYTTWYKSCSGAENVEAKDPRFVSAISVGADASVGEIIQQLHSYCTEELYTDKYKSKSGALMGSKTVKQNMESRESTRCSNADWRQSISKLDLNDDIFYNLVPKGNPCDADKVYHYVMAGIGSWVSNLANVMYTQAIAKGPNGGTIAFRDQRNRHIERWDLLFEHEMPICMDYEQKSTPFVRPDPIERLKIKSVCDYAATKMFFTRHIWQMMSRGQLKNELKDSVAKHIQTIRAAAQGTAKHVEYSGAYIGLHLRHKWEFKLQPPKLVDVATLVKSVANQINPFSHFELEDANPTCFANENLKATVWGPAKVVIFCASDEVEACQVLQDMLGHEQFFVHTIPNLKLSTGREGILSYLLDVALLEKSAIFIGSGASNLRSVF
jgi:hypothetical protein